MVAQDARQHVMRDLRADFSSSFNSVDVAHVQPVGALCILDGEFKLRCRNAVLAGRGLRRNLLL
ncbi:hypothetical protein ACH51_09610 [Ralstonia solanacearum]|nr:hypothetical protein ACH51_09610 [Ralstonia solanacearum]